MQTLVADVQGLRKGLDLTKTERDKQPDNFVIFVSFSYFPEFFLDDYNICAVKPLYKDHPRVFVVMGWLNL